MVDKNAGRLKVVIWMNFPSHHQSAFFTALDSAGVDLHVVYYGAITGDRLALGWKSAAMGQPGITKATSIKRAIQVLRKQTDAVHVIPGYGGRITPFVAVAAAWHRIAWVHWSEPAHPGTRWWIDWPRKWLYAQLVNYRALGALAIGLNAERDFIRWGIRHSKIRQLPYSRGLESAMTRLPASSGALVFGFVGALCRRKGVDDIIPAFGEVARRYPFVKLVLVGRNDFGPDLDRLIQDRAVASQVEFHPAVAPEAVGKYLSGIDVFVMPSRFDGWGVALQEAALAGCALISTRTCGAATHLVRDGINGVLIDRCSVATLSRAMERYAANPRLAAKHGAASPRIAAEFLPEANARRLVNALTELSRMD